MLSDVLEKLANDTHDQEIQIQLLAVAEVMREDEAEQIEFIEEIVEPSPLDALQTYYMLGGLTLIGVLCGLILWRVW